LIRLIQVLAIDLKDASSELGDPTLIAHARRSHGRAVALVSTPTDAELADLRSTFADVFEPGEA
tara:strand:+ start:259 stop:450 length:192 start_codon:yes stop_codon:yes gene_type:complete